jgi:hypothetical protein
MSLPGWCWMILPIATSVLTAFVCICGFLASALGVATDHSMMTMRCQFPLMALRPMIQACCISGVVYYNELFMMPSCAVLVSMSTPAFLM